MDYLKCSQSIKKNIEVNKIKEKKENKKFILENYVI